MVTSASAEIFQNKEVGIPGHFISKETNSFLSEKVKCPYLTGHLDVQNLSMPLMDMDFTSTLM